MSMSQLLRVGLILFLFLYMSACAISRSDRIVYENILELSETDFVLVVRPESIKAFDQEMLRKAAVEKSTKYSLSKYMIPMLISEFVEPPSDNGFGYIKQHIRLLKWQDAQVKLKGGLVPLERNVESMSDNDVASIDLGEVRYDHQASVAEGENVTQIDNDLDTSKRVLTDTEMRCLALQQEYENNIGKAVGDFCKGHRLGYDYYNSLQQNGCNELPELLELAILGVTRYCDGDE